VRGVGVVDCWLVVWRSGVLRGLVPFAGALKFWRERSRADFRAAEQAVWSDDAVAAALQSAGLWTQGLQFVRSLAGLWKFHLAPCPEDVPEHFFSLGFDDGSWGSLPGAEVFESFLFCKP
jgi:beta-galactosidase/beta-glucuronidase